MADEAERGYDVETLLERRRGRGRPMIGDAARRLGVPTKKLLGLIASVSVDGVVLAGDLERRALELVTEWARLHREELLANWELARDSQPIRPIAPLP